MPVEIASWRTRCYECGDVFGDEYDSEDEARERDTDAGGMCADCVLFKFDGVRTEQPTGDPTP